MKKTLILSALSIAAVLIFSPILKGQDWWQDDNSGIWENENDGGFTVYFPEYGDEPAVAVLPEDEQGGVTTDPGEMKKAMEAAEDGHTYEPEGEDRKKWKGLSEQKEGESKGGWFKRLFRSKKNKSGDGIVDGCDPKKLDDWMHGRFPGWGHGIILESGQSPVRMQDPRGTAGRIAKSIR